MSTPTDAHGSSAQRSNSRTRTSRPTTPLRPSSRSSFRESARGAGADAPFPLNAFEPAFAELSDAMADLEANLMHFQLMHESVARFSESFASFLYGLNMNAFCVDFPEGTIPESFRKSRQSDPSAEAHTLAPKATEKPEPEYENTFMTTDTSFVENPNSTKTSSKFATPNPRQSRIPETSTRGTRGIPRGGGGGTRGRGAGSSGLARARGRAVR